MLLTVLFPSVWIQSIKTTSQENISTGILDKNIEHYLRCKDKAEKTYDVLRHIPLHMSNTKNEDLQSIMSTYSPTVV